jgi:hypothetical protein
VCDTLAKYRKLINHSEEIATPTWACFRAPTSLVPSPHISVWYPGKIPIINQSF